MKLRAYKKNTDENCLKYEKNKQIGLYKRKDNTKSRKNPYFPQYFYLNTIFKVLE